VAAILSLNGAKNNPKSYKNHGGPAKGGPCTRAPPPPLNTPLTALTWEVQEVIFQKDSTVMPWWENCVPKL